MRSLLDQYRRQGARSLLDQARGTVADLLEPRRPPSRPLPPPASPSTPRPAGSPPAGSPPTDGSRDDVLAGVCAGIALRDLNLLDSLLAELERMEAEEQDPDALDRLYRLDHLATRLRRNAENLRVLAGEEAGAAAEDTASLVDVIRAAISAIERYPRVDVGRVAPLAVVGFAADDVSRLLTELLDNATAQSPPSSPVTVSAHITENGSILLRVEDMGIGLPQERMAELNERLSTAPALDSAAIEHMGLAVVRRLADKHGVRVWLGRRAPHGTTASVLLPAGLVREAPPVSFTRQPEPDAPPRAALPPPSPTPRRSPAHARSPHTRPGGPDAPRTGGVTAGGLPRRVPTSLRVPDSPADLAAPFTPPLLGTSTDDGFFADLADFDAGERAARGTPPEPDDLHGDLSGDLREGGPSDD
ncbi:ATP-binding protein [Saccharothrix sp. BKS2]|uniref:sensor histidine kinase n=1 Tax=Saccharothrix sp. BKS2 TaxID=3064400 RepID=UPI0039E9D22E